MLGELRSILKLSTPIIAMTATATSQARVGIMKSLGMHNVVLIHNTPSVHNIKHVVVQTTLKDASEIFHWLCESLLKKQMSAERVIIFCQSRRHCSELYSAFSSYLPQSFHQYFNMFHTNTENDIQEEIAKDFSMPDGKIRVLFATIAFGLGIDVKGVHNVIMYGCPSAIDDYVQLSGRGGRDGEQSLSIIIDIPVKTGSGISAEMKQFVNTKECRREILKKAFPASRESFVTPHDCCDNCSSNCVCLGQVCNKKMMAVEKEIQNFQSTFDNEISIRVVSDEDYESVKQALHDMWKQSVGLLTSEHMYAGPEVALGITKSTVNRLLSNLHLAFTYTEFVSHFHFPNTEVADQVWALIQRHVGSNAIQKTSQVSSLESEVKDDIEVEEEQLLLQSEYAEAYLEGSDSD
ncbi:putative Werner syndrome ATP-dependent helicase-like 1 [Holothuria leucospilota]|uniref:DNA 3'-5' helicase n=1 Tax=Holothuria leucospilota TaxID=206669 RepID=A0A9Q1B8I7_HOLLE|nr:putative Werner syndrome ATP-dependent helicase-like 1 [Holothuria leucospilota]